MLTIRSTELETPIAALSSLNFDDYDKVIAEFRKKNVEKEATKQRALEAVRKLIDQITALLARFPMLEAKNLAEEFRQVELAERMMSDGVIPTTLETLESFVKNSRDQLTKIHRNITKGTNTLCPHLMKIDPRLAADLRRLLNDVGRIVKRLITHYQHMIVRVDKLTAAAKSPPNGRVLLAYELYKSAFQSFEGVHGVGKVFPDLRHMPPIYELPIAIDPNIYGDRGRLRELERAADEYVEKHDPISVGAIAFRFELADGAA